MNHTDLVSIIVPVYGVEKYLPECVDSLLAQTHTNIEVILIDDASQDGCAQICDRYAQKDARVKVVHKNNGGAASARNAGLDVATGAYICFVDADDVVKKEYVEYLLTHLLEADADIAVCGYYNLTRKQWELAEPQKVGLYSQTEYLAYFLRDWSCALLWNKIYRRDMIGSLRMAEGHKIDDEFFTYQVVMNCRKVVVTDQPLYGYRIRVSSVMHDSGSGAQRIMLDRIEYMATRYGHIAQRYPELEPAFFLDMVDTMTRLWRSSQNAPTAQKEIRRWAKAHKGKILSMKAPLRQRVAYLYHLFVKKPTTMPEPDSISVDTGNCFD